MPSRSSGYVVPRGADVATLRRNKGKSLKEAAEGADGSAGIGIEERTLRRVEKSERTQIKIIKKVADYYGVPIDSIIEPEPSQKITGRPDAADYRVFRVAYISPVVDANPFYTQSLERLIVNAGRIQDVGIQIVPMLPTRNLDSIELWSLLEKVRNGSAQADAVIFIPDYPDENLERIIHFRKTCPGVPLVLFDVSISRERQEVSQQEEHLPHFIGGDEQTGGRIAAQIALDHLAESDVDEHLQVLHLFGADTVWESRRSQTFLESILAAYPKAVVTESPSPLKYSRLSTYEQCISVFDRCRLMDVPFDVIYACNDHMAFGARSAVLRSRRKGFRFKPHLGIVGYDGTNEMKHFLQDADPLMLGTVDVNIDLQTSLCVETVKSLLTGHARPMIERNVRRTTVTTSHDGKVQLVKPLAVLGSRNP